MRRDKFGLLTDAQWWLLKPSYPVLDFRLSGVPRPLGRCAPGNRRHFLSTCRPPQARGRRAEPLRATQLFTREQRSYITKMAEDPMH